jgi:hypothetical protein
MKDAKGHGSNPRGGDGGGAHSSGVSRIGQPVSSAVLDTIRQNPDGFSVSLNGDQPKSGYMVALSQCGDPSWPRA